MRVLTAILLLYSSFVFSQKNTNATLTNANVYYGYGAELTHTAKATVGIGQQELVINNISPFTDAKTLQIACPENIVLLSHQFKIKVENTPAPVNPVIKKMEDSLKIVQKFINQNTDEYQTNNELLTKTSKIVESYINVPEKTINTPDVIRLIDFYNGKIQLYRNTAYTLKMKGNDLQEQYNDIMNRMGEIRRKEMPLAAKNVGQLVLQIMAKEAVTANFGISYYTQYAGWVPTYDIRVKGIDNSLKLVYKAMVSQTTGLDWKQVKLTLSTSNPNLSTGIPALTPWHLQYYVPQVYEAMKKGREAAYAYNRAQSMNVEEVVIANNIPAKEDYSKNLVTSDVSSYTTLNESQLFTSYDIDLAYDIPTDGNGYSVAIKEEKINASYKHYAIPKLDKDAFLLAEISNWESLELLPGEANIIMDNVYLGKSFIDPNTTMDTLNLSLGRDKRVALKRLLVKENSRTKFIGTNKVETFTYEITVKNNKKEAVNILLKDQYPLTNIKEIEVKLEDDGKAEVNEELGSLNWKVSLQPGEQRKYRFTYSIKYPKDKKVVNIR